MKASIGSASIAVTICAATYFVVSPPPLAAAGDATPPMAALIDRAKSDFRTISEEHVATALRELKEAVARLDRRLERDSEHGQAWREELLVEQLQQQLTGPHTPDKQALLKIHARFNSGRYGLNLAPFADVRRALVDYLQLADAHTDPGFAETYREYLDSLAASLDRYREEPTAARAIAIGTAVGAIENLGQAPELIRSIRDRFGRENLHVFVDDQVVTAGFDRPVDRTEPVRDVILGTTIRGTGHTTGETTGSLANNEHHAVIDLTFLGVNRSDNRGFNGPVTIHSQGITRLGARARLYVNDTGLHALPTKANAHTRTHTSAIRDRKGRRIVERIAWRRAAEQKCLAEAIAADHAEQRLRRRVDAEVADAVAEANEAFTGKFRDTLTERGLFPATLDFSSTTEAMRIDWLYATDAQIAAATEPPPLHSDAVLGIRLHESVVNNMAQTALGGMTVHEPLLQADIKRAFGRLPERLRTPPGEEPWGVGFADRLPIELDVADGQFTITIRGRRYHKGDQRHPGMNVWATYAIDTDSDAPRAVRQGDLNIFPPGFNPDTDRLSTRQQVIRTLLKKRFDGIFGEEITIEPLKMSGRWSKLGELTPVQFEANGDWLVLGWKLPERE